MRRVVLSPVVWLAVPLALLAGCGESDRGSAAKSSGTQETAKLPTRELPPLGDYLPPLDNNRLELAPPQGWYVPSASRQYVVRVQKGDRDKYPSVTVTAEDYRDGGVANVSEENVKEFAAQVADAVNKERSAVQPRKVGDFVGVAYAKRAKIGPPTRILDVLYLETVVAGRKYRFELRSEEGSLDKDRPYLYAVVNGTRFLEAASKPEPEAPPEPEAAPKGKEKPPPVEEPDQPKPEPEPEEKPDQQTKETAPEGTKAEAKPKAKEEPEEKPKKKDEGLDLDLDKLDELINKKK